MRGLPPLVQFSFLTWFKEVVPSTSRSWLRLVPCGCGLYDKFSRYLLHLHHDVNYAYFQDYAGTCQFYCYNYEPMAETLSGVSGEEYDMLAVDVQAQTLTLWSGNLTLPQFELALKPHFC